MINMFHSFTAEHILTHRMSSFLILKAFFSFYVLGNFVKRLRMEKKCSQITHSLCFSIISMLLVSPTDFFPSARRHQVFHFFLYGENKSLHLKHRKRFSPHSMFILCLRSLLCRVINCKHHHSTDFSGKCGSRMMKTLFFFFSPFFLSPIMWSPAHKI